MSAPNAAQAAAKAAAWATLRTAAREATETPGAATAQALAEAACEWARAKGWREPRAEAAPGDATLPNYGRNKGQPISGTETKDLEWYAKTLRESIDNPEKARWVEANQRCLDAIEAELETRDDAGVRHDR